ncbi:hypothetical protein [Plantibacter sp. ME-Dv--P-122b]|uniref:hypothetical protein n=1 Tax=Plantibacter sp. ME-Dv--P-122b TaxID=3040300 RepID=UPI00254DFC34|nr:hypothetical protein [Plantibacter sp. ME-Dv--P-122b]
MTIEDLLAESDDGWSRKPRTVRQVLGTLGATLGCLVGFIVLVVAMLGSFQGSYSSHLEGDVSVCGYAGVASVCQQELREQVRTTMHIPLAEDVRVEKLRRYGFPDPIYQAQLSYPSAADARAAGHTVLEVRASGAAVVTVKVNG